MRGGEGRERGRGEAGRGQRGWRGGRRERWKAEEKGGVNEGGRGEGKEMGEGIRGETSKQAATWRGEEGRTAGGSWEAGEKGGKRGRGEAEQEEGERGSCVDMGKKTLKEGGENTGPKGRTGEKIPN